MSAVAILLLLLAGAAVGATSIGGVLVVPVLTAWAAAPLDRAIAASSFAFAFTGAAAFALPAGRSQLAGSDDGLGGWPLHGAALLGAAIGAATLGLLPPGGVRTGLGLLAVATGIHGLLRARSASIAIARRAARGRGALAAIGLGVGCASAWSGTGGPVLLLPLLALSGWRTDAAVAAAQRIQLPVALAATAVHLAAGRLDLRLGLVVGALVLAGWAAGRWIASRMTTRRLAQAVALAMIGVGAWYLT